MFPLHTAVSISIPGSAYGPRVSLGVIPKEVQGQDIYSAIPYSSCLSPGIAQLPITSPNKEFVSRLIFSCW